MSIKLRVALLEDKNNILEFLRKFYYVEEPLTIGSQPPEQTTEDEEFTLSNIQYGTCILAVKINSNNDDSICDSGDNLNNFNSTAQFNNKEDYNEEIIGVAIAGPKYPNEANHIMEMAKKCKTLKWINLLKLFAVLEQRADVFNKYNVTKAVHLHALSVHKNSRGKSISSKLIIKCMEIAKELDYQLFTLDCTSVYSIKLAEKLNMDCVGTLAFEDYRDEQGVQIFKPPSPHKYIKTFAKLL